MASVSHDPSSREPWQLSASEALKRLRDNKLSVTDYAKSLLERIDQRQDQVKAWVSLDRELILSNAAKLDSLPAASRGPLHGLPVGVKDVMLTADMPTQHNSKTFESSSPSTIDASVVRVLRLSGALIFGKTTTTEWASVQVAGSHQNHTTNPCVKEGGAVRTPGGSSSGSAAAVSDGQVPLALATQTIGSTVRPASYCGIWGWKPTWGSISREGSDVYSWSSDTMGFLAQDAEVFETLYQVFRLEDIEGRRNWNGSVEGLTVGFCKSPIWQRKAGEALIKVWEQAKKDLEKAGAVTDEVSLPSEFEKMEKWHADILTAEGRSSFLGQYMLDKENLPPLLIGHIENRNGVSRKALLEAYDGCSRLRPVWDQIANGYDVIITPSVPEVAPKGIASTGDSSFNGMWTILHGPAINIPGYTGEDEMPFGLTAVGARYTDERLIQVARAIGKVFQETR